MQPQIIETPNSTIVALPVDADFMRPTVLRVMDIVSDTLKQYHNRQIHLSVRHKRDVRWTPRFSVGKPTCSQARPYTKMAVAEFLNDLESTGNGAGLKAGELTSTALDILSAIERGVITREKIEELAYSGISLREFKKLRSVLKK